MHPLIAEQTARALTEERLRTAAAARRVRSLHPVRRGPRDRLGTALIRVGTRLRGTPPAQGGVLHDTRVHRHATSLARAAGPC